jgi:hypothetical protein
MREHFPAKWIPLLGALVFPMKAKAADFPSQLWGRSIIVSLSVNGGNQPSSVDSQLIVYISGAGRTFGRMTAGGARSALSEPGRIDSIVSTTISVYFEKGALLADAKMISGAISFAIAFDPMYATCTARAIFEGDGRVAVRGKDVRVSSCSIRQGNALVGGDASRTAPTLRSPSDVKQYYRSDKN